MITSVKTALVALDIVGMTVSDARGRSRRFGTLNAA
jgi:hypothetical protein